MDKFHKALIAVILLLILWIIFGQTKKTSGYSDVQAKAPTDQCPPGFQTLGPVTCVKP